MDYQEEEMLKQMYVERMIMDSQRAASTDIKVKKTTNPNKIKGRGRSLSDTTNYASESQKSNQNGDIKARPASDGDKKPAKKRKISIIPPTKIEEMPMSQQTMPWKMDILKTKVHPATSGEEQNEPQSQVKSNKSKYGKAVW